jgi:hypothetical protein
MKFNNDVIKNNIFKRHYCFLNECDDILLIRLDYIKLKYDVTLDITNKKEQFLNPIIRNT